MLFGVLVLGLVLSFQLFAQLLVLLGFMLATLGMAYVCIIVIVCVYIYKNREAPVTDAEIEKIMKWIKPGAYVLSLAIAMVIVSLSMYVAFWIGC